MIVHNRYRTENPSGENAVVDHEIDMLSARGHDVIPWLTSSDSLSEGSARARYANLAEASYASVIGGTKQRQLMRRVDKEKPDVVHFHNLVPFYSPLAIKTIGQRGCATLQTLHNYRRRCVKGTLQRSGSSCSLCSKRRSFNAVIHSCYQNSSLRSVPLALSQLLYADAWRALDRHLVLTEFQREWLELQGIPAENITVRPTSSEDAEYTALGGRRLCFVGRVDLEKGVDLLIESFLRSDLAKDGWKLDVVGDGPQLNQLRSSSTRPSVVFHGRLAPEKVTEVMRNARAIAVPSRWLEGFPKVISEAFAIARPVLVVDNPNLRSVVAGRGWSVPAEALSTTLTVLRDEVAVAQMGAAARLYFESSLERSISDDLLVQTYSQAIQEARSKRNLG